MDFKDVEKGIRGLSKQPDPLIAAKLIHLVLDVVFEALDVHI